jgi:hypothetical protein
VKGEGARRPPRRHRHGDLPKVSGDGLAELPDELRIELADRIEQVLDVLEPVAQPV